MNDIKKSFHIFLAGVLTFMICSTVAIAAENFRDVTVKEASLMIKDTGSVSPIVILDVRTKREFDSGHLNDAINIDINSAPFKEEISKLNKNKTYLVYCRSGKRSKRAQNIMKELRFHKSLNMLGGFIAWEKAGYPFIK